MNAQPAFLRDREQAQVDQLMAVLAPDNTPLFRDRETALAALRRLRMIQARRPRVETDNG